MSHKDRDRKKRKKLERDKRAQARTRDKRALNVYLHKAQKTGLTKRQLLDLLQEPLAIQTQVFSIWINTANFRKRYLPSPFPKHLSELGAIPVDSPDSFEDSLRLALAILEQYPNHIAHFLDRREAFSNHIMTGQLNEAAQLLADSQSHSGTSLWLIEAQFLLSERHVGLDANRAFLAQINAEAKDQMLQFYAAFLTQRVESSLSVIEYESALTSAIPEKSQLGESIEPIIAEVEFRLSYHRGFDWPALNSGTRRYEVLG